MATRVSSLPTATPYVRLWLALGEPPTARVHGWVTATITGGADHVPPAQLWARYGPALAAECLRASFEPAYLTPLDHQSGEAQAAARTWEARVLAEGRY